MFDDILLFASRSLIWVLGFLFFLGLYFLINRIRGAKRLEIAQLVQLMNEKKATLVDIRDPKEFRKEHIKGSINHFGNNADTMSPTLRAYDSKEKFLVLICERGASALDLGASLRRRGFETISILKGGLQTWRDEGLPLTKL